VEYCTVSVALVEGCFTLKGQHCRSGTGDWYTKAADGLLYALNITRRDLSFLPQSHDDSVSCRLTQWYFLAHA